MRVVLDTNIYLSALIFPGSKPAQILNLAKNNKFDLYINDFIISEINQVLMIKFNYKNELAQKVIDEILKYTKLIITRKKVDIIKTKKDDNRILECAMTARADFLITGDKKHILPIKKIENTKIVSAKEFLEIIKKTTFS